MARDRIVVVARAAWRARAAWVACAALAAYAALAAACGRDRSAGSARGAAMPPPLAGASFYRIDAGPQTPCTAGATCEARLVLTALGDYHVNENYPFKFIGDPSLGFAVDGSGTFALDD